MKVLESLFRRSKPVIGMLHVPALPGSPENTELFGEILERVVRDAEALADGGIDGMILENFGDTPFFPARVPAHTVAFLAVLAAEVKRRHALPLGINLLRNDGIGAVAIAAATGAEFIRVNVYTGARLADQGILEGEAHLIQRYRRELGSAVKIFADVAVKHSAPFAARDLAEEVEETFQRGRADAVIVSGAGTGKQTSFDDLRAAKAAAKRRAVLVGSGAREEDLESLLQHADGIIAGTALKENGEVRNRVSRVRVEAFVTGVRRLFPA
jgi:membrane complex biogenesis BtpA family protein